MYNRAFRQMIWCLAILTFFLNANTASGSYLPCHKGAVAVGRYLLPDFRLQNLMLRRIELPTDPYDLECLGFTHKCQGLFAPSSSVMLFPITSKAAVEQAIGPYYIGKSLVKGGHILARNPGLVREVLANLGPDSVPDKEGGIAQSSIAVDIRLSRAGTISHVDVVDGHHRLMAIQSWASMKKPDYTFNDLERDFPGILKLYVDGVHLDASGAAEPLELKLPVHAVAFDALHLPYSLYYSDKAPTFIGLGGNFEYGSRTSLKMATELTLAAGDRRVGMYFLGEEDLSTSEASTLLHRLQHVAQDKGYYQLVIVPQSARHRIWLRDMLSDRSNFDRINLYVAETSGEWQYLEEVKKHMDHLDPDKEKKPMGGVQDEFLKAMQLRLQQIYLTYDVELVR